MAPKAASFFSYNLSRPYPYSWFTPVGITILIIASAIFTFLNFASNGYNLILEVSSEPNVTVSSSRWLHHWPSFFTAKVNPTCEATDFPVNSLLFTNQTALVYNLASVWIDRPDGSREILPSLDYYNQVIQNCSISSVDIDYSALDRAANQFGYSEWGAVVRTFVTCQIATVAGVVSFNLTQRYEYVPDTVAFGNLWHFLGTNFLGRNLTSRASLWWGESLMSTYWAYTTYRMGVIRRTNTSDGEPGLAKGFIAFTPNTVENRTVTNITDPKFFHIEYRFLEDWSYGRWNIYSGDDKSTKQTADEMGEQGVFPNIWPLADILAKAAWSTVLTDLGQLDAAESNLLADASTVEFFTANISVVRRDVVNTIPGPAEMSYAMVQASSTPSGPIGLTPSVFSAKYICQVPKLKSAGALLVSIFVADLVLIQGAWWLYKNIVEWFMFRANSNDDVSIEPLMSNATN